MVSVKVAVSLLPCTS